MAGAYAKPKLDYLSANKEPMIPRENFPSEVGQVIAWIESFFERLESLPVKSQMQPGQVIEQLPKEAPVKGEVMSDILNDLDRIILPGMTHWQHPGFHAYFPANGSVESLFAEFITAALGAQCMIWDTSPAAAELEQRVLEWIRDELQLAKHFEGVIQDSASSATLVAILTAREVKTDFRSNEDGVPSNLRVYCSHETHSSIDKAVGIAGIGRRNLVHIDVDDRGRLLPEVLKERIQSDIEQGYIPCCVVASIGTTGRLAIDPLAVIADICNEHDVWLHVDAAFAGTAALLPEYRWIIEGINEADSFVFNPHKWMFTNFDCSAYYVRDAEVLIKTFEILPEYLKTKSRGQVNDYRDWGIPLGRRFRALKLWFVMRSFGMEGIRKRLRQHIKLNDYFSEQLNSFEDFEVLQPALLNFSLFRYRPSGEFDQEQLNLFNQQLLDQINRGGKAFLSHTKIDGMYAIRCVIGQTYVEKRHVDALLQLLQETADNLNQGAKR